MGPDISIFYFLNLIPFFIDYLFDRMKAVIESSIFRIKKRWCQKTKTFDLFRRLGPIFCLIFGGLLSCDVQSPKINKFSLLLLYEVSTVWSCCPRKVVTSTCTWGQLPGRGAWCECHFKDWTISARDSFLLNSVSFLTCFPLRLTVFFYNCFFLFSLLCFSKCCKPCLY